MSYVLAHTGGSLLHELPHPGGSLLYVLPVLLASKELSDTEPGYPTTGCQH